MKKILILEDASYRMQWFRKEYGVNHKIVHVEHIDDALKEMEIEQFDILFLDHDLEDQIYVDPDEMYNCGSNLTRQIAHLYNEGKFQWLKDVPIVIHSHNPAGVQMMVGHLQTVGLNANIASFADLHTRKTIIKLS